jgi:hypothetical protein
MTIKPEMEMILKMLRSIRPRDRPTEEANSMVGFSVQQ